jgi:hypothetical protein
VGKYNRNCSPQKCSSTTEMKRIEEKNKAYFGAAYLYFQNI